jgi:hypothetical protein
MRRVEGVDVIEAPVADGGEGTAAALAATRRRRRTAVVQGPLGHPSTPLARAAGRDGGDDSAQAVGLALPRALRDARATTLASATCRSPRGQRRVVLLVGVGGRRPSTAEPAAERVGGDSMGVDSRCLRRDESVAGSGAPRVFGPQKGQGRRQSPRSSGGSQR